MFRKIATQCQLVALCLLLALSLSSCRADGSSKGEAPETGQKRYEAQFLTLFDTVTKIVAYSDSKEAFTEQAQQIHDDLEQYHQLYNIYDDFAGISNLKTINDNAGIAPVKVDRRIIDLLLLGREMYGQTGGKVNIAMGSVLSIWHEYREAGISDPENAALPPMALLRAAAQHTDIAGLIIDEAASTVYLEDPEMRLDVGAIAKGYAVEQVCRHAEANGLSSGLISVGGNVRAIGGKGQNGSAWTVGIQDPWDSEKLLETVSLADISLVTSGTYQRYYTVDGKQYHHIIDPETLLPAAHFEAVSILCRDSGYADAFSTAVFNMPLEEGMAFIESLPEVEALWVQSDGQLVYSSGFEAYRKSR